MKRVFEKFGGFLRTVGRSCYDMEFYRAVRTRSLGRAVAYVASFGALLCVLGLLFFGPQVFRAISESRSWLSSHVPEGATFEVKKGVFSTNIPVPNDFGTDGEVVVDTAITGRQLPEDRYPKAQVVIGRDAAWVMNNDIELRTYNMSEIPDLSLTKKEIIDWIDSYGIAAGAVFLLFTVVLYWLFFISSMAFYVMLMSLLALFAGRLWNVRLEFAQWLSVGFHAVTLPVIVNVVLDAIGLPIPYAFSFIYVLFVGAVIADERSSPAGPVVADAAPLRPSAPSPSAPAPVAAPPKPPKAKRIAAKPSKSRKPRKKTPPPTESV